MKKHLLFILMLPAFFICLSCDNDQIEPGTTQTSESRTAPDFSHTAVVEKKDLTRVYEAVGTIRPLTESVIESQVSAQVLKVNCVPGQAVTKGQPLILLDARRLKAQLEQAKEGLSVAKNQFSQTLKSMDEAKAGLDQAQAAYNRSKKLFESGIVSSQQLEIDKAGFLQAKARLENAQEGRQAAGASIRKAEEIVNEARIGLGYAEVTAPETGVVAERRVDPGDLAIPGKPLLVIQTSGALRLEANIREGLIHQIRTGDEYPVDIRTIGKSVMSKIEEIVPYADPATRTFLVKASLPATEGIYPGMFGRLLIPVETEATLLIPEKAVIRVGQLEMVWVKTKDSWQTVYIKTGKLLDDKIEVLSGLSGSDTIGY